MSMRLAAARQGNPRAEGAFAMKILIIGDKVRTEKYLPDLPIVSDSEWVVAARGSSDEQLLGIAADADKVLFAPHIGGVTSNMFKRAHRFMWENAARIAAGKAPLNIVNR